MAAASGRKTICLASVNASARNRTDSHHLLTLPQTQWGFMLFLSSQTDKKWWPHWAVRGTARRRNIAVLEATEILTILYTTQGFLRLLEADDTKRPLADDTNCSAAAFQWKMNSVPHDLENGVLPHTALQNNSWAEVALTHQLLCHADSYTGLNQNAQLRSSESLCRLCLISSFQYPSSWVPDNSWVRYSHPP